MRVQAKPASRNAYSQKAVRVVKLYRLLKEYMEVSRSELEQVFPGVSQRTLARDISLLRRAGANIVWSAKQKAYLKDYQNDTLPAPLGNSPESRFINMLRRFIDILDNMSDVDCGGWYRSRFPELSERTMHRDFALLKRIGVVIYYQREEDFGDREIGKYYIDELYNVGEL